MPSAISHAVAALGIRACFGGAALPRGASIAGIACSLLPDADVVGFRFGIQYGDVLGHRGLTHSLAFAALVATSGLLIFYFYGRYPASGRLPLWSYLFLATASHGVLDALTSGGLGVAFFAPFVNDRYFFPFRPILVSRVGLMAFFTRRGLAVLPSEMLWVWLPSGILSIAALLVRRRRPPPG